MTKRVSPSRAKSKPTSPGKQPAGSSANADRAIAKLEQKIEVPAAGIGIVSPAADVADNRPRQTAGPACPNCPGNVCVAQSTKQLFTWYVCPDNCGFRVKIPRPDLRQHLDRQRAQEPAVKRP